MRGSADQKNSKYGHFSRGVSLLRHLMRATFTSSVKSIPALDHVLCGIDIIYNRYNTRNLQMMQRTFR